MRWAACRPPLGLRLSPVGWVTDPNLEPDVWRVSWQAVLPLTRVGTSQKAGAMEEEGPLKSQRPPGTDTKSSLPDLGFRAPPKGTPWTVLAVAGD